MKLLPKERRELIKDITGHLAALLMVIGFFFILYIVLMGYVDITNPAVIAFVGTAIGYAAGNIAPIAKYYYGSETKQYKQEKPGESGKDS